MSYETRASHIDIPAHPIAATFIWTKARRSVDETVTMGVVMGRASDAIGRVRLVRRRPTDSNAIDSNTINTIDSSNKTDIERLPVI